MIIGDLEEKGLISPPSWLSKNTVYVVTMGSEAYGAGIGNSDIDLYGVCIPRKEDVFPHLRGEIFGFGKPHQRFDEYQQHHIIDPDGRGGQGQEYDISIYSIVKYFQSVMNNNPNMLDSLFVPVDCIRHMSTVGMMIRDNRKLFLHKGAWHKMKGYAFSQISKCDKGSNSTGKRKALIDEQGTDTKFLYHTVRLLGEAEQILVEGDLDLRRNSEQLKAIRAGLWTVQELKDYFNTKERELETVYTNSTLQHSPDEARIKQLLIDCLEQHYGTLAGAFVNVDAAQEALNSIQDILTKYQTASSNI